MTTNTTSTRPQGSTSGGIGCFGIAFFISIILGILKVASVLELSWWLVAAPVLIVGGLTGVALLLVLLVLAGVVAVSALGSKRGGRR